MDLQEVFFMNNRFSPTNWLTAAAAGLAVVLGGCATSDPDMISRDNTQTMSQVLDGVVLSVRQVTVDGSQSGVGGVVGGGGRSEKRCRGV
jgi:outer membrane lipoprotein SlyB